MRKVYQAKGNGVGLPVALAVATSITALIFCVIPFSHLVNKPGHLLALRKTRAADLPPPVDEPLQAPPSEPEARPEAPPEPLLTESPQQIAISADLDVAVGAGGALAGFGEAHALSGTQAIADETFDVSELGTKPEAVSQVPPVYPAELRKAKIEGSVTLVFVLNENGRVEEARVENSSRPEFERPALEAIRKWRFRPGMKDGQAVRTYIRIPMRFRVGAG